MYNTVNTKYNRKLAKEKRVSSEVQGLNAL